MTAVSRRSTTSCATRLHRPPLIIAGVTLEDHVGPSTVDVKRQKRLCTPADKYDEDPTAPLDPYHLGRCRLSRPRSSIESSIEVVVNQFGAFTVDLVRPDYMMVPTTKSLTEIPPAPVDSWVDHFKCYAVRGSQSRTENIKVDDQFGTLHVDLKRPVRVCAPANKNDEDPDAPTHPDHLMCFKVRITPKTPRPHLPELVFTQNQFRPDTYRPYGLRELCVPSQLFP